MTARLQRPAPSTTFEVASRRLSRFVTAEARKVRQLVGFGWRTGVEALPDYPSLVGAYDECQATGIPLPIGDQRTEPVIYTSPAVSLAFRFWHDITHVRIGADFDVEGEIEVAVTHLDVLRAAGFGPQTLEFELLSADTLGHSTLNDAAAGDGTGMSCGVRATVPSPASLILRDQLTR